MVNLLLLALLVALAFGGYSWMRSTAAFSVQRAILPQVEYVTEPELRRALAPAIGRNLFSVSPAELEERLLSLPYVKEAQVHRRFPHTLEVMLVEEQPRGVVAAKGGQRWLVSADGRVLGPTSSAEEPLMVASGNPPVLEAGQELPSPLLEALPLLERLKDPSGWPSDFPVSSLQVSASGLATVLLISEVEIRMGEPTRLDDKLMVAAEILQQYSSEGRKLEYVDVYLPDRPVAKEIAR
jgi:cell division protein FtsQ